MRKPVTPRRRNVIASTLELPAFRKRVETPKTGRGAAPLRKMKH